MRRSTAAFLAASLAASVVSCTVQPGPAQVVGPAPDTHPRALAGGDPTGPSGGAPWLPDADAPAAEDGTVDDVPDEAQPDGTPLGPEQDQVVVLFEGGEPRWMVRPGRRDTGDAVGDALVALARPLTDDERAAGLSTAVPSDLALSWLEVGPTEVVVDVTAGSGVPPEELLRLGLQVACTVHLAEAASQGRAAEVLLDGEPIVWLGPDRDGCP